MLFEFENFSAEYLLQRMFASKKKFSDSHNHHDKEHIAQSEYLEVDVRIAHSQQAMYQHAGQKNCNTHENAKLATVHPHLVVTIYAYITYYQHEQADEQSAWQINTLEA